MIETCSTFTDMTLKLNTLVPAALAMAKVAGTEGDIQEGPTQGRKGGKNLPVDAPAAASYKVNINDVRTRFFAELVYLFFYKILLKFPENMQV